MGLTFESWYPKDPETCLLLANVIVIVHFAVVIFVVGGEILILLGGLRRWGWVAGRVFRALHLAIIVFVAGVAAMGDLCPLTIWENALRELGGKPIEQSSFLAYWAHELLFVEVDLQVLTFSYIGFALLVVGSLFIVPVRWRKSISPQ
jgi:hypothetical protein